MRAIKYRINYLRGDRNRRGIEPLEARKLLSTVLFTVSDTSDSVTDTGSLRYALTQANLLSSTDHAVIDFDFGSTAVQTIKLTSGLPAITGRVDILGPTDSQGDPLLVLDGADAGSDDDGLVFDRLASADTAASVVSGLIINNFTEQGIYISGAAPTDVYGCWIGTSATGKHSQPNGDDGIQIANNDDKIGEEGTEAYADLISGNGDVGIRIDSGAVGNTIQNCRIGTDVTGKHALGNSQGGIIDAGDQTLIGGDRPGQGNVISGNEGDGVDLDGVTGCILYTNLIGTNAAGTAALGNAGHGVVLDTNSSNDEIGNNGTPFANVISGNANGGVFCAAGSDSNLIEGNNIGVNEAGTAAIPNDGDGIIDLQSNNNTYEDNVISGNTQNGIEIETTDLAIGASGNTIESNEIGTNEAETAAIPNGENGIEYENVSGNTDEDNVVGGNKQNGILIETTSAGFSASENVVEDEIVGAEGGVFPAADFEDRLAIPNGDNGVEIFKAADNTVKESFIWDNKLAGVQINGSSAVQNVISNNSITSNGLLGICLGADTDTPLPNHNGTATGPNDDQNYPVLTSAAVVGENATIDGTLNSLPNLTYTIEFFDNASVDPSGFGQGLFPVGQTTVTTDGNGNASFTGVKVEEFESEPFMTAVAIDTTPNVAQGDDTSEFSKAIAVTGATVSGTVYDDVSGSGKLEAGDKGEADVEVYAEVGSAESTKIEAVTNSAGQFKIIGLKPNVATEIHVDVPDGYVQTEPSAKRPYYKVTLAADGSAGGLDFGIEKSASNSAVVLATENGPGATALIDLAIKKATIARELLG